MASRRRCQRASADPPLSLARLVTSRARFAIWFWMCCQLYRVATTSLPLRAANVPSYRLAKKATAAIGESHRVVNLPHAFVSS